MDEFEALGAAIVVVSFAQPERLAHYQKIHQWRFTLLADPDRSTYSCFGLRRLPWYRVFSFPTMRLYFEKLRKGRRIESYGKDDYLQGGGDFLLNDKGLVLFEHRSRDPSDRPAVTTLIEIARRANGKVKG